MIQPANDTTSDVLDLMRHLTYDQPSRELLRDRLYEAQASLSMAARELGFVMETGPFIELYSKGQGQLRVVRGHHSACYEDVRHPNYVPPKDQA